MAAANVDHADRAGRHRGHGRPRRSGVKVDPGRHRGQDTRYNAHFHARAQKEKKEKFFFHYSNIFFLLRVSVLVWPASLLESGGRRLALGFPGLCEAGQVEPDK